MSAPNAYNKFWNISNALSLARVVLTVPAVCAILRHDAAAVFTIGVIACITDFLDGYLARRLNQVTEWGKQLDPIADKILVGGAAVAMMVAGMLPVWFVAVALARDVIIFTGGMYVKYRKGVVLMSNMFGKYTVGVITIAIVAAIFDVPAEYRWIQTALLVIATVMMAVSLGLYTRNMVEAVRGEV